MLTWTQSYVCTSAVQSCFLCCAAEIRAKLGSDHFLPQSVGAACSGAVWDKHQGNKFQCFHEGSGLCFAEHGKGCAVGIWQAGGVCSCLSVVCLHFPPFTLLPKLLNLLRNRIAVGDVSWVWCPESYLVLWDIAYESWKSFMLRELGQKWEMGEVHSPSCITGADFQ